MLGRGFTSDRIAFGPFILEGSQGRLWRGPTAVPLRRKAWEVLRELATHRGTVVSSEDLLAAVWGEVAVSPQVLTNTIHELRIALADTGDQPRFIETIRGRGYLFLGHRPATNGVHRDAAHIDLVVGREPELRRLEKSWQEVSTGRSRVVVVSGEPGIGKTTLVNAFLAAAGSGGDLQRGPVARGVCVEQHGREEAYLPLFDAIEHLLDDPEEGPAVAEELRRCAPAWLAQLPWRTGEHERGALERSLAEATTPRMLQQGIGFLRAVAERCPLVLVVEDVHWSDLATLDLLGALARRPIPAPLLVLATYRPVDGASRSHSGVRLVRELVRSGVADEVSLPPLDRAAIAAFVTARFGNAELAGAMSSRLEEHSAGNPLFLRTLIDELIARRAIELTTSGWRLTDGAVATLEELPHSLRAFVAGELERMSRPMREVVEAASVTGLEFTAPDLAAALTHDAVEVERACEDHACLGRLLRVAVGTQHPDGTNARRYAFVHAAYRRFVYEQIPPLSRRSLHLRTAAALETTDHDATDVAAARLATHYERGGDARKAAAYFDRAAAHAERRFAYRESAAYLRGALAHAAAEDGILSTDQIGGMQLRLAGLLSFVESYGAPGVGHALAAARDAFLASGSIPGLFMSELGLGRYELVRARNDPSRAYLDHVLALSESALRPLRAVACCWAGFAAALRGELVRALELFDEGLACPESPGLLRDMDAHRLMGSQSAVVLSVCGDLAGGRLRAEAALMRARTNGRPGDLTQALLLETEHALFLRAHDVGCVRAGETIRMAHETGLPSFLALARFYDALFDDDRPLAARIAAMREAISERRRLGDRWHESVLLTTVAELELENGNPASASAFIDEAAAYIASTGERHYLAEVQRVRGELAGSLGGRGEHWLSAAIETARAQGARLWELRAATSRARLAPDDGVMSDLQRTVATFPAGETSRDLVEAHALLEA